MPTRVTITDVNHDDEVVVVNESTDEVTTSLNAALDRKFRFITLTTADGKQRSLVAEDITDIREV